MAYATTFRISNSKQPSVRKLTATACFGPYYNRLEQYKYLSVYTYEQYVGVFKSMNRNAISFENQIKYAELLKKAGFVFTTEELTVEVSNWGTDKKVLAWHINLSENSCLMNLILLNAIRYSYEGLSPEIVNAFFDLVNLDINMHFLNRFFLAHCVSNEICSGHSIKTCYQTIFKIYTDADLKNLLENRTFYQGTGSLLKLKNVPQSISRKLTDFLKLKKYEDAISYWKELNEKYGTEA